VSSHDKFINLFTSAHPNIAVFIKNLLIMLTDSYIRINTANNKKSRIVRTKRKTNMEFINKNIELYNDDQLMEYWLFFFKDVQKCIKKLCTEFRCKKNLLCRV
jgi:hypothetical protein